jgi:hypothetical protein
VWLHQLQRIHRIIRHLQALSSLCHQQQQAVLLQQQQQLAGGLAVPAPASHLLLFLQGELL